MNNLKKIRKEKNMQQLELVRRMGITSSLATYYENVNLSGKMALKAEEALGVNVFEILGEDMFTVKPRNEEDVKIILNHLLGDKYVLVQNEKAD